MIDPIDSLAFSMQANPGVYALLIGSGVSRAAEIPTGWEITLDLIRKLAKMKDESAEPSPEDWYCEKFGKEPNYSKIIKKLEKTRTGRQQLLRQYFEPNKRERKENEEAKQPTAAHRAIARLVAKGYVKIILTTNFDRLIENALKDEGVEPTVLTSPDQVKGMVPLVHTPPCVIKLHGDYRDTRILNTPNELAKYYEFDNILDQIFDEFGLIVCGWSAKWDTALRKALERASSRRFTTYWTIRGEISEEVKKLAHHRRAEIIEISGADHFFETVQQKVYFIEQFSQPHPLSVAIAVESMKRYLSEPRYLIKHSDIVYESVEQTVRSISNFNLKMKKQNMKNYTLEEQVYAYETACAALLAMAPIAGRWAKEDHFDSWQRALVRLATIESENSKWLDFQRYPTALLLYSLGLGAISSNRSNRSNRFEFIAYIFSTLINRSRIGIEPQPVTQFLFENNYLQQDMSKLEGMNSNPIPLNTWIYEKLRNHIKNASNEADYAFIFNKLEILIALNFAHHDLKKEYYPPLGIYVRQRTNRKRILGKIEDSISTEKDNSPFVKYNIFGKNSAECSESIDHLKKILNSLDSEIRW